MVLVQNKSWSWSPGMSYIAVQQRQQKKINKLLVKWRKVKFNENQNEKVWYDCILILQLSLKGEAAWSS